MSIDNMLEQFKDFAELKTYTESQSKTIIELNKKINKIEKENKELKLKLEDSKKQNTIQENTSIVQNISNEEAICNLQLKLLNQTSLERELTMEETRKVEIFSKILAGLKSNKKDDGQEVLKNTDAATLLTLLVDNESKVN